MGKEFSAADARRVNRRVTPERRIAKPMVYQVHEVIKSTHVEYTGTFKTVAELCPKVNPSTLKRRLDTGERRLDLLRLRPQKPSTKKMFNNGRG